ncbi:uncharacterized protein LOC125675445 isoform X4 [Ostrea edulis]|uniref:uncharacterized protein LOC125675445 isoform X4 n=1 Tax=Ostrea edulis TaxID=37623 RepID=UPI0024AEB099|nr:uncharacterized protein LOC125675445 isoform X4 [Ostrea edulis]
MDIQHQKKELLFLSALFLIHLEAKFSLAFQNCPSSILTVSYTTCPSTEEAWRAAAKRKNCPSIPQNCTSPENFKYHCVTNAFRNETIEVCAPSIFLLGFCPEYNFRGERIQDNYDADCKQFTKPCPSRFESWKSYQFPECTTTKSHEAGTHPEKAKQSTETIILFVCIGTIVFVVVGVLLVIRRGRKTKTLRFSIDNRPHASDPCQPSPDSEKEALNKSTYNGDA